MNTVQVTVAAGVGTADPSAAALRWAGGRFSAAELQDHAARFGGLLKTLGVQRRDVVLATPGTLPEMVFAMLGTIRFGAIFGVAGDLEPDLRRTRSKLLLIEASRKPEVDPLRAKLKSLWHVVAVERFSKVTRMGAGDFLFADYFAHAEPAALVAAERALATAAGIWSRDTVELPLGRDLLGLRSGDACAVTLAPTHPMWPVLGVLAPLAAGAEVVLGDGPAAARVGSGPVTLTAPDGWAVPLERDGRPLQGLDGPRGRPVLIFD